MAADVKIDIAAEFTGKKAFKQSEKSTDKIVKRTKRLAGTLCLDFGTQRILAYAKTSVKSAAEDQGKANAAVVKAIENSKVEFEKRMKVTK